MGQPYGQVAPAHCQDKLSVGRGLPSASPRQWVGSQRPPPAAPRLTFSLMNRATVWDSMRQQLAQAKTWKSM